MSRYTSDPVKLRIVEMATERFHKLESLHEAVESYEVCSVTELQVQLRVHYKSKQPPRYFIIKISESY